jgi:hypothetical protein
MLDCQEIDRARGAYFLGATAPDVRVITRNDRAVTHFFDLAEYGVQDSVGRMFREYPDLEFGSDSEQDYVAFILGYITHLVLDELFISEVYRPIFAPVAEVIGGPRANLLDRVMQYEVDRVDRTNQSAMESVTRSLRTSFSLPNLPFIEQESLVEWLDVSIDISLQPPDYSRFAKMLGRHIENVELGGEVMSDLEKDPERLLEEAYQYVSLEEVADFLAGARIVIRDRLLEYLR